MVIENKNWLDDLYCWLHDGYRHKEIFKGFCSLMADFKEHGFSYDELYTALTRSEKIAEDIMELSILTKNNYCYKYRVSETVYAYFCNKFFHHLPYGTDTMLLKDFWIERIAQNTKNLTFLYQMNIKLSHAGLWIWNQTIQAITFPFLRISKRTKISESFAGWLMVWVEKK